MARLLVSANPPLPAAIKPSFTINCVGDPEP